MASSRTKTIPGYQIQPMLPISFYLDGTVQDAEFIEYEGKRCVEARVTMGLLKTTYTLILSLAQAREADIIETV